MLDKSAWKVDDPEWVKERGQEWREAGASLVGKMYNLGGDLNQEKAEAIKKYFMTGMLDELSPFPLYYRIRFYPGYEEEFIWQCLETATDLELGRFVVMYKTFGLDKHDESFAKLFFSDKVSDRLERLRGRNGKPLSNRKQTRDRDLVSEIFIRWRRVLSGHMQIYPPHFYDYVEDRCLEIACNQGNRTEAEQQEFIELLGDLMKAVAEFAEPLGLPGENTESKQKRDYLH